MPAARSRWRRWAAPCGWTSRATSGRSSSRFPRTSSCCSGSTCTRCSPTGRCPSRRPSSSPQDRTLIVELDSWYLPDTHGNGLSLRTRQELGRGRGHRPSQANGCATSTAPGCTSSPARTTAASFASGGPSRRTSFPPTPSSCASTPALACTGASCARPRACCCAGTSPTVRPSNPFVRFAAQLERDLPRLLEGDAERLPRLRVCDRADGRLGVRGRRLPGRVAAGGRRRPCLARRCSGSSRAARSSRSGSRAAGLRARAGAVRAGRGLGRGDGAARCRARLRRSSHRSGAPMLA